MDPLRIEVVLCARFTFLERIKVLLGWRLVEVRIETMRDSVLYFMAPWETLEQQRKHIVPKGWVQSETNPGVWERR